jgi:hypothetical protein
MGDIVMASAPRAAARARHAATALPRPAILPRSVEYAFIQDDLRRMAIIAVGLFGLMLAILVLVTR